VIIESEGERRLALGELDRLMGHKKLPVRREMWFAVLAKAIEAYEKIHFPIADPRPEEAAAFRLAEGGPICEKQGHVPIEKMSAVICDRCRKVLRER
jgi:hypothetical protein